MTTSPNTAVVIIPDAALWPLIEALRYRYDRQAVVVMPHITLLYPFCPHEQFEALLQPLAAVCAQHPPFAVTLARFDAFAHDNGQQTLWLAPEPAAPLIALQTALWEVVPDCDSTRRYPGGFVPHLTVGQAPTAAVGEQLLAAMRTTWLPMSFTVRSVALLARSGPEAPFQPMRHLMLQASS
jgi:2'-5' RNA ligase